jgi:hypothetical protein
MRQQSQAWVTTPSHFPLTAANCTGENAFHLHNFFFLFDFVYAINLRKLTILFNVLMVCQWLVSYILKGGFGIKTCDMKQNV